MLSPDFAKLTLDTYAAGQPAFVSQPILWASGIILVHHVAADAAFGAIQLAIGLGLLIRPTARVALGASIVWALGIWYLGEGLGGIASGHAAIISGAPGSALLYAVVGAAVWPAGSEGSKTRRWRLGRWLGAASSDLPPRRWVVGAWALLWLGGMVLLSLPSQASADALAGSPLALAPSAPAWLASWDYSVAAWILSSGNGLVTGLTVLEGLIGVVALIGGWPRRTAIALGIALALADWVIGQGLGSSTVARQQTPTPGR